MNEDVKLLIAEIKDKKLREQLIKIITLTEKIEKIEKISDNAEKIMNEVNKLEKILKGTDVSKLDDKNKQKLKTNIQKVLKSINKLLTELTKLSEEVPKDIDVDTNNIDDVTDKLSQAFNNLLESIPPQFMDSLQPQLNNLAQTLQQLQQAQIQKPEVTPQQQPITHNLANTLQKLDNVLKSLENTNTSPVTKRMMNDIKKEAEEIKQKLANGQGVDMKKLSDLSKKVAGLQNTFIPQEFKNQLNNIKKELNDLFNQVGADNINQNLNSLESMTNQIKQATSEGKLPSDNTIKKALDSIEKFLKNPQTSNMQNVKKDIIKSSLPDKAKKELIDKLNNIQETIKTMKNNLMKDIIRDINQTNSKITKAKNQPLPKQAKSMLEEAQKLLNQSMFNPNKENLQKALDNIQKAKDLIENSGLSKQTKDKLKQQLSQAQEHIRDTINKTEDLQKINNLNNIKNQGQNQQHFNEPNKNPNQHPGEMPPMPPMPFPMKGQGGKGGQEGGQGSGTGKGQKQEGGTSGQSSQGGNQSGESSDKPGKQGEQQPGGTQSGQATTGSQGSQGSQGAQAGGVSGSQVSPEDITQAMNTLQQLSNTVSSMMQEEIRNLMDSIEQIASSQAQQGQQSSQSPGAQQSGSIRGGGMMLQAQQGQLGQQGQAGNGTGGVAQQLSSAIQQLQQLASSIQNGSASPADIQQGIQQLQQMANMPGINPTTRDMINSAINSLQNIQALNQIMQNITPVSNSVSQATSMINQLMSSFTGGAQSGGGVPMGMPMPGGQSMPGQTAPSGGKSQQGGESKPNLPNEGFLSQEVIDMLNKLSNANLTESQRKRLTQMVKDILKIAKDTAKKISGNQLMSGQEKKSMLQNLASAIKNNLHNLNIDDELLDLAQQFDDALGNDYSGGLSGGMFASVINDIEKVDINEAMNQLTKMSKEWIEKYRDLFDRLVSDIIELKTKEIGYYITPHGKKIDYRRTVRRTVNNAGIPYIVKKDRDKAIGDFLFVLDASGSMHDVTELKNATWMQRNEIEKRLGKRMTQYQVGLITAYVLGEAIRRVGEGDYKLIVFADKMTDLTNASLDVILYLISNPDVLNKYVGGGTNLRPTLLEIIRNYLDEDMNVVLFTDTGDASVWDTFTLTKLKEKAKRVGVFCAGDFFEDTAKAFARADIPVFAFNSFDELFEIMKQYYIAELTPERALEEVREYLKQKEKEGKTIKSILPNM